MSFYHSIDTLTVQTFLMDRLREIAGKPSGNVENIRKRLAVGSMRDPEWA